MAIKIVLATFLTIVPLYGHGQNQATPLLKSTINTVGAQTVTITSNGRIYQITQSIGQQGIIGTRTTDDLHVQQGFLTNVMQIDLNAPSSINDAIMAYPNHVANDLFIAFNQVPQEEIVVAVFDISGRYIKQRKFSPLKTISVPMQLLQEGVYVLNIKVGEKTWVKKVIRKNN